MIHAKPEVLVVGAGPVGMLGALALAKEGIEVAVIDKGVWPCAHSYALALHPKSLELLGEFGLREKALAAAYPIRTVGLYDAKGRRAGATIGEPPVAVMRQDVLEQMLEEALKEAGVKIHWNHETASITPRGDTVAVQVDEFEQQSLGYAVARTEWVVARTQALEVPFVIGADGYNSVVRRTLGLDFAETGPAQYYAVFECRVGEDLAHEMAIVAGGKATDVLWPLPGGRCRWSFELLDYADPVLEATHERMEKLGMGYVPSERTKDRLEGAGDSLPVLAEEQLNSLLRERAPWFTAAVSEIDWRTVVRFERRLAAGYGRGRLWLAGDAAHLTGPGGIQSMNAGLQEVRELAHEAGQVVRKKTGMEGLARFEERWRQTWRDLLGIAGPVETQAGADAWISERAGAILGCLPGTGVEWKGLAAQLGLAVR
ncbi:MAG: FAD-dependent monooxygenase [Bryobacter sp.]|nr:FAD-dependent monooxygenase [Bryobacter sp.]